MQLFSGLAFTKFITRTTSSSTGARSAGKILATSASVCKKKQKKTVGNDNILVPLFHTANEPYCAPDQVQTLIQFSHVSSPCSRYSDTTPKYFHSCCFFRQCPAKQEVFSDGVSIHKTHWPKFEHSHRCP